MDTDAGMETSVGASEEDAPPAVARWEKLFFAAVGLSALWIGFWGYFLPEIQKSIPFSIPALHARFLGAMYLSAFVLLLGGCLYGRWSDITVVPAMTAVWTSGIFVVSLLHTDLFDFSTIQTWIWFVAYGVYPAIALWVAWAHRNEILAAGRGGNVPAWVRAWLLGQGILLALLAAALFVAPSTMAGVWPWPIPDELAQLYSAPFLSFGIGSLLLGRMGLWSRMRTGAITMAVFAVGVLTASFIHRSLFSSSELPDRLWFGLFTLGAAALVALSIRSFRSE
jgi:hypothetical protein